VDGSGPPEPLATVDASAAPYTWSPEGKLLAFRQSDAKGRDIWLMPAEGQRTPRRWMETQFDKQTPQFSPDGRWLAYVSGGGANLQVFVQAAPSAGAASAPGARWQVSVDGGRLPRWSRDGRELFYNWQGKLMSAPIEKGPAFRAGTPRALFEARGYGLGAGGGDYDVSPDGKRFLFIKSAAPETASGGQQQFQFVLEWFDEVRRRVEAGAAQ
jgi:serine/threonine-protein kinase